MWYGIEKATGLVRDVCSDLRNKRLDLDAASHEYVERSDGWETFYVYDPTTGRAAPGAEYAAREGVRRATDAARVAAAISARAKLAALGLTAEELDAIVRG